MRGSHGWALVAGVVSAACVAVTVALLFSVFRDRAIGTSMLATSQWVTPTQADAPGGGGATVGNVSRSREWCVGRD